VSGEPTPTPGLEVSVDRGRCCGYAVCMGVCPEVFDLDDDGLARVLLDEVPPELEEKVRFAEMSCPEAAIKVCATAGVEADRA